MRPVYLTVIGDSIVLAANDDGNKGGIVGRLADWALTQPGLKLRCIGNGLVENHFPGSADPQGHEGMGGYQLAGGPTGYEYPAQAQTSITSALANRVDTLRDPTFVPMFGPRATSIYQPLDFVIDCGGANNLNNPGEPTATTHAEHRQWLTALRSALDVRGLTATKIVVMGGYLDINTFQSAVVAANATVQTAVYDAIDALNPGRPLIRLNNWYNLVGLWTGTGVGKNYFDNIHPNGNGYDAIMNGGSGMLATLGPLILAAANESLPMGSLSTYSKNALLDHVRNKATHSPAATHYLHLYSGVGGTTPLAGTGNGYAAISKTNNTTTWPNAAARVKANGTAWTFPTPTGTWPDVTGWKLTDSATEGAGNVLAQDTHTAVPVSLAGSTGPIAYGVGALTITAAAAGGSSGGFVDSVVHGLLNLMFGGTAYTQLTTTYGSYWAGNPQAGGSQVAARVALTQASVWTAASGGISVSGADVSLTQQATGTYWAEHDASSGGNLLYSTFRPATVGATGTIQAGQLRTSLTG